MFGEFCGRNSIGIENFVVPRHSTAASFALLRKMPKMDGTVFWFFTKPPAYNYACFCRFVSSIFQLQKIDLDVEKKDALFSRGMFCFNQWMGFGTLCISRKAVKQENCPACKNVNVEAKRIRPAGANTTPHPFWENHPVDVRDPMQCQ